MSSTASSSPVSSSSSKKKRRLMILPHANDLNNRLVTSDLYGDITIRALLKKTGFDPDDVNKYTSYGDTAMHYICFHEGNLTMVQILVACGADCRALDRWGRCPLYHAAHGGHWDICKWLYYDGGAKDDIRKREENGYSPLRIALCGQNYDYDIVHWMIVNEALSLPRKNGAIDDTTMRHDLRLIEWRSIERWETDRRLPILAWAQAAVTHHDQLAASIASSLVNFNGQSVILERIGEYAGKLTPNGLRIVRELVEILPVYIKDTPFATMKENNPYEDLEEIESEEDDTEDYDY